MRRDRETHAPGGFKEKKERVDLYIRLDSRRNGSTRSKIRECS